ncbi:MAG TPA: condensation domain-containing protein, partial [Thermoanaerobaculia bacterium]
HLLVLALHHIVADGWSAAVFGRELAALHAAVAAGLPSPLPELPLQYSDFASWQRGWLAGEAFAEHLAWWRQNLAGAPARLELPADRPRPAVPSWRGARVSLRVPPVQEAELRRLARRTGVTLFMTLLAAFDVLLSRWTGEQDLVVGAPVANRERLELEGLIGCFVNVLPLRIDLSHLAPPGIDDLLARVRQVSLDAFAHQDLPFEKLVAALAPRRSQATTPLFQVVLVLQTARTPARGAAALDPDSQAGLAVEICDLDLPVTTCKFDLALAAAETPGGLELAFDYSRDLFDAATIKRLAVRCQVLLAALAGLGGGLRCAVAELPWLSAAERQHLLEGSGAAARTLPPGGTGAPSAGNGPPARARSGNAPGLSADASEQERLCYIRAAPAIEIIQSSMTSREQSRRTFKLSQSRHELLAARLRRQASADAGEARIARRRGGEPLPLSFGQQRLWFVAQLAPESSAYNQAALFLLQGRLDAAAMAAAFAAILRRHEVLRSTLVAV